MVRVAFHAGRPGIGLPNIQSRCQISKSYTIFFLQDKSELPFQTKPRNPLSSGLASLRDEARGSHPIEELEKSYESEGWVRDDLLQNVYGTGFIARKKIERQLLNRCGFLHYLSVSY